MKMRVIGGMHTVHDYCFVWAKLYRAKLPSWEVYYGLPDGVSVLDECVVVKRRGRP